MSGDSNEPKIEDSRLQNWSAWLKEWHKVQVGIAKKLGIGPEQVLMNYAEGLCRVKNEKLVLDYAKIPTDFDRYRGNPSFWKLPTALPKHCKNEPVYQAVQTKIESLVVPTLDCVGVADYIQNEKNILPKARSFYKRWQNCKYRKEQMEKLACKINSIIPHWPRFEELIVLGKNIYQRPEEPVPKIESATPSLTSDSAAPNVGKDGNCKNCTKCRSKSFLAINNIVFGGNPDDVGTKKIRLYFDHDASSPAASVNFLDFENNTTVALRISFTKLAKFRLFPNYPELPKDTFCFCFDKNELVILPGHSVNLPIWFKAKRCGSFSESWTLHARPKVWGDASTVVLVLNSHVYYKDLKQRVDDILNYIETETRNLIIKDTLRCILDGVKYTAKAVVPCVYEEADLFEIANMRNGAPSFLFNKSIVDSLKEFGGDKWDLSASALKQLAHCTDLSLYHEQKAARLADKIASMARNEPQEISLPSEQFVYCNQTKLWNLLKKLDWPIVVNLEREKYFACGQVLTAYFTKMCALLESGFSKTVTYPSFTHKLVPIDEQPTSLIWEYFESNVFKLSDDSPQFMGTPKPKILLNIPGDKIEIIYSTYFNKSTIVMKKEEKVKPKEKRKKQKLGSKSVSKELVVDESFNPWLEQFHYVSETEERKQVFAETSQSFGVGDYKYQQYLLVYSCLSEAVNALVDTLQSFECKSIKAQDIQHQ